MGLWGNYKIDLDEWMVCYSNERAHKGKVELCWILYWMENELSEKK